MRSKHKVSKRAKPDSFFPTPFLHLPCIDTRIWCWVGGFLSLLSTETGQLLTLGSDSKLSFVWSSAVSLRSATTKIGHATSLSRTERATLDAAEANGNAAGSRGQLQATAAVNISNSDMVDFNCTFPQTEYALFREALL